MPIDPGTVMAISGAASAALGVGGNIIQNRGSAGSQKRAYNYQRQLNEQQADLNMNLYRQQFDYEAAYNTPLAQMERYRAAGINPFVAAKEGIGQSETSVGAPSVSNGQAPSMYQPANVFGGIPSAYAQMAQAFLDMSKTKGQDIENDYQRQSFDDRLRALGLQIESQEVQNSIAKLQQICDMLYKIPQAKALLDKTQQEIVNLAASKGNIDADTALKGMEKEYYDMLGKLTGKQKDLLEQQFPYLISQARETVTLIQQQQQTEKAKQFELHSSGQNQLSQAGYYRQLGVKASEETEFQRIMNSWQPLLNKYSVKKSKQEIRNLRATEISQLIDDGRKILTFIPDVRKSFAEGSAAELTCKLLEEKITYAMKTNNYYELNMAINDLSSLLGAGARMGAVIP